MKLTHLLVFIFIAQVIRAQEKPFYAGYTWDERPHYEITSGNSEGMVALKDKYAVEFAYDDDGSLTEYSLEHRVLWLNSDEKIEAYNKIYLPYSSDSELKSSKARVITKDGKIVVLDDSKILTAQDEETGRQYKYFAFEGIEKGSFIEYFYVEKKHPDYQGSRYWLQSTYPKKDISFDLYAPSNLIFKFKSYNSIPPVSRDTLSKDKGHWALHIKELEGLENEEQSAYNASKAFLVYKLDRNLKNNSRDISSYDNIAQGLYGYYYSEYSKKTQSLLDKFISDAVPGDSEDLAFRIRELEMYIKTNVFLSEGGGDDLKDLQTILTKKVANTAGMVKLYVALFKSMGIRHEMVLTCDREQLKFDKDFEAANFLTDFLFYFPDAGAYLSPTKTESRFGFPPASLTDNYGLFIKEVKVGDYKSAIGQIKYIDPVEATKTVDKMILDIGFDKEDISRTKVRLDRSFTGYYAMYIQPFMYLVKEKDKEELVDGFAKRINENVVVVNKEIINEDPHLFGVKPLEFILDIESDAFTEKAGDKYLFKVGELIGQQMQMYQEKERKLPYENDFKRSYFRTINIRLPEGYEVANLEDLNIDNTYRENGKELLSFKSYFKVNDGVITITADEHYRVNIIDTPLFEEFRKVINSAADFNKITLVLQPTG